MFIWRNESDLRNVINQNPKLALKGCCAVDVLGRFSILVIICTFFTMLNFYKNLQYIYLYMMFTTTKPYTDQLDFTLK